MHLICILLCLLAREAFSFTSFRHSFAKSWKSTTNEIAAAVAAGTVVDKISGSSSSRKHHCTGSSTDLVGDLINNKGLRKKMKARIRYFVNLTNGIEAFADLRERGISMSDVAFVRIQSTACENRNYNGILESLDNNLLMNLALGNLCVIFDYGSRGTGRLIGEDDHRYGIPRAFWQGVEFIRHSLEHFWRLELDDEDSDSNKEDSFPSVFTSKTRLVRGYNSADIFDGAIRAVPKVLRRRLKFFRPYVTTRSDCGEGTGRINLFPVYKRTQNDGLPNYYYDELFSVLKKDRDEYCFTCSTPSEVDAAEEAIDVDIDSLSPETLNRLIQHWFIPEDFHLYRSDDFSNLGRNS